MAIIGFVSSCLWNQLAYSAGFASQCGQVAPHFHTRYLMPTVFKLTRRALTVALHGGWANAIKASGIKVE